MIDQYHRWKTMRDGTRYPVDILDNAIATDIPKRHAMFIWNSMLYIYDGGCFYPDYTGSKLCGIIKGYIFPDMVTASRIERVKKLVLMDSALYVQQVNQIPADWIVFKNGILDPSDMTLFAHSAAYRIINMIPHNWTENRDITGSICKKFLGSLIPNTDDRKMFLEYAGYMLTRSMKQQLFMVIYGPGGTGKSALLRLLRASLGEENYCAVSLQQLTERFATSSLVGRQAVIFGDLPAEALRDTSVLKMIVGEDSVRAEYKGRDPFTFSPYAKLIFSANSLPANRDERSDAFYRRLLVLRIPKRAEELPDLENKLMQDIDSFIYMAVTAYRDMLLSSGRITISEMSRVKSAELFEFSDSVQRFINAELVLTGDRTDHKDRGEIYRRYQQFCWGDELKPLGKIHFFKVMEEKGFTIKKFSKSWDIIGIKCRKELT